MLACCDSSLRKPLIGFAVAGLLSSVSTGIRCRPSLAMPSSSPLGVVLGLFLLLVGQSSLALRIEFCSNLNTGAENRPRKPLRSAR